LTPHLLTHQRLPEQTFNRITPVSETIIWGATALDLALCRADDEFSEQIEFSPMNLANIVDMCVWISFVCPDKILNMDFSGTFVRKVLANIRGLTMQEHIRPWSSSTPCGTHDENEGDEIEVPMTEDFCNALGFWF
jgi:hypothetical protein